MNRVLGVNGLAVAISAGLLVASSPAQALTSVEANAGPQFNFVNPGARSLGMAGAFLGLADDSTAAYTNPAGLGQLDRLEFVVEARNTRFVTSSVKSGRLLGTPTGIGIDTVSGLQTQDTDKDVSNLSFLSFAFPLKHGTLAVYRHELANFEAEFASDGPIVSNLNNATPYPAVQRILPTISNVDLQIVNYGFAGGWRIHPKLMLGASLNHYRFKFDTLTRRYAFDANADGVNSNFEQLTVTSFDPSFLRDTASQLGKDSAFGFNVGLLWQPNARWSLGAVYRRGPEFQYDFVSARLGQTLSAGSTSFKVPDTWGVGLGFRPSDAWRVSLDLARVQYSDHAKDILNQNSSHSPDFLTLNDTTEVRLGAEYTATESARPYSIRFGLWHEPAHQLFFAGTATPFTGTPLTIPQRVANSHATLFQPGEDALHYTAGYGVVFKQFQIDTAVDISRHADIVSLSLVYYLK